MWRELLVKLWSDFGDVQPHMIGGGSLSQAVGHLSPQIGSVSKRPVNLGTFFSNQVSNVCISAKKLSASRDISTSAWDLSAGTQTSPPIRRARESPSTRVSLWERGCR